jgi:hypothetical protein
MAPFWLLMLGCQVCATRGSGERHRVGHMRTDGGGGAPPRAIRSGVARALRRVTHPRVETHLGRLERVIWRDANVDHKGTALVGRACGAMAATRSERCAARCGQDTKSAACNLGGRPEFPSSAASRHRPDAHTRQPASPRGTLPAPCGCEPWRSWARRRDVLSCGSPREGPQAPGAVRRATIGAAHLRGSFWVISPSRAPRHARSLAAARAAAFPEPK